MFVFGLMLILGWNFNETKTVKEFFNSVSVIAQTRAWHLVPIPVTDLILVDEYVMNNFYVYSR